MSIFSKFFGVIIRGQTYLNILYMLLALPLGAFYYVFLVGGIVVGVPLMIIFIGILILIAVFAGWVAFIAFERQMAIWLLRVDVPPYIPESSNQDEATGWISGLLTNRVTWTGLFFLFIKFPLGVFSFALMSFLFGITLALLSAPFTYNVYPLSDLIRSGIQASGWQVDTIGKAILLFLGGLLMIFVSFHLLNIMGWVWGRLAYWMLGRKSKKLVAAPVAPAPVEAEEVSLVAVTSQEIVASPQAQTSAGERSADQQAEPAVNEKGVEPLITPPPGGEAEQAAPIITPPPQETSTEDEVDTPAEYVSKGAVSPPEWLLEEEAVAGPPSGETSDDDTSPIAIDTEAEQGEQSGDESQDAD